MGLGIVLEGMCLCVYLFEDVLKGCIQLNRGGNEHYDKESKGHRTVNPEALKYKRSYYVNALL